MLMYENGRFSALGVSFALPDGCWLETVPEFCYERGFGAWSTDRLIYLEWQIEDGCEDTKKELSDLFRPGMGMHPLKDIEPVTVNGLYGHRAMYSASGEQLMEMRLTVSGDTQISLLIRSKDNDIASAIESEVVLTAINEIRPM